MAMRTLGEALESALASILNEVGEGVSAATDPDAAMSKKRPSRSPAKFQEIVSCDTALPVQEVDTDKERRIALASPKAGMGRPSPAVRRSLFVVVEGGRPATSGGTGRAAYAQARGGNHASNLVLIEGGRRHWTASPF